MRKQLLKESISGYRKVLFGKPNARNDYVLAIEIPGAGTLYLELSGNTKETS